MARASLSLGRHLCSAPAPLDGAAHSWLPPGPAGSCSEPGLMVRRPALLSIPLYRHQPFTVLILRGALCGCPQYSPRTVTAVPWAPPECFGCARRCCPVLSHVTWLTLATSGRLLCARCAGEQTQVTGIQSSCKVTGEGSLCPTENLTPKR